MALGLLLGVSWICFLLFDGSAGIPAVKGYGYPYKSDSRNAGLYDDEALTSSTYDQSNRRASNNQATTPVYTNYRKPTLVQPPYQAPSRQTLPNTPRGPEVERLANGASRNWGQENLDKPLSFPLLSNPAIQLQPGPAKPLSTSYGVSTRNSMPASRNTAGSTAYASPTAYNTPSSASKAVRPSSFDHWQREPVRTGYGDAGHNSFSAAKGKPHRLVYEEVFKYPSDTTKTKSSGAISNTAGGHGNTNYLSERSLTRFTNTPSITSYSSNVGARPAYPSRVGHLSGGANFGPTSYKPQKPGKQQQEAEVPQRVSKPIYPPAPPPSYIIQSKNGYRRSRYRQTYTRYSPEYPLPMPVRTRVKGPAKPAAPKGGKTPSKGKW